MNLRQVREVAGSREDTWGRCWSDTSHIGSGQWGADVVVWGKFSIKLGTMGLILWFPCHIAHSPHCQWEDDILSSFTWNLMTVFTTAFEVGIGLKLDAKPHREVTKFLIISETNKKKGQTLVFTQFDLDISIALSLCNSNTTGRGQFAHMEKRFRYGVHLAVCN